MARKSGILLAGCFLSAQGIARQPIEDLAERLRDSGYSVICCSSIRRGWLRVLDLLFTALVKRPRYDVAIVDLFSGYAFFWGAALSKFLSFLGCPFILALHGGGLPEFGKKWPRQMCGCLNAATAVVAPSPYLRDALREWRSDITLMPNAIDLSRYHYTNRPVLEPNLIWLRTFRSIYDPQVAPQVVRLLSDKFPNVKLTMIGCDWGDGSFEATEREADRLQVVDRVRLIKGIPKDEVPNYLSQADIFLNTSSVDNTPVSVIEAMACGLPVVSTNVGGMPKLIDDRHDGVLVPPNDADAMATAVAGLLRNPQEAALMAKRARTKVVQFGWSTILPKWGNLLAKVSEGQCASRFEAEKPRASTTASGSPQDSVGHF